MKAKKPVYNGYEERYLNGAELKETFANQYYCNGRHHSVILGITIPDYGDFYVSLGRFLRRFYGV